MKPIQNDRKLVRLEDMFGLDPSNDTKLDSESNQSKTILVVPINRLQPKRNHRFQVNLGKKNEDLLQSIKELGVLEPIIVRPVAGSDKYEILAGHRRTAMAREAGLTEIPVVIKEGLTEAEADLIETETNLLQRSWKDMSHSERAAVLYAHYNAINQKGIRTGFLEEVNAEIKSLANPVNTRAEGSLSQGATKGNLRTSGEAYELSKDTVGRYLKIYLLTDELKERVDLDEVGFLASVEISHLTLEHQKVLNDLLSRYKITTEKAEILHRLEKAGKLTEQSMEEILMGVKPKKPGRPKAYKLRAEVIQKYFGEGVEQKEIDKTIEAALEMYFNN